MSGAFFRGTGLGGLVDARYTWFSTKPEADAQFRNFDTRRRAGVVSVVLGGDHLRSVLRDALPASICRPLPMGATACCIRSARRDSRRVIAGFDVR
jgi:hypothetical protein